MKVFVVPMYLRRANFVFFKCNMRIKLTLYSERPFTFTAACSAGYSGQFCDEPVCRPMCHQGACVRPDTCHCDIGWTGDKCDVANCGMPCTSHGNCTAPDTCTCERGWQGMTCEMPFAPGFQSQMRYVYNLSLSYTMESDILMKTNESTQFKGLDVWNFLSEVNITFSVTAFPRESNISIGVLRILNAVCSSDYKNQTKTTLKNMTCNQDSIKSLLTIKVMFSQNLSTGKILNVYFNASTEAEATFISRILRFIDSEIQPMEEKEVKMSTHNGKQVLSSRVPSKSQLGMQCYDFNRTVKTENMVTDREEKKVCMGESGSPEIITMMEVFHIGQDIDLGEESADGDDTNLAPLPSFKGHVTALGSLISMTRITNFEASRELDYIHITLAAKNTKYSAIDEMAFQPIPYQEEYKDSNFYEDVNKIMNHPFPNRRLSLGIDLIKKTTSAFSVIKKIIFTQNYLDNDSRSVLIAMLGASDTIQGQKVLLEMIEAKETIKGDHYLALGAITQLSNVSEDFVSAISKRMKSTFDEDVKIRSILVLGALGSKGLQHKIIPILSAALSKNNVRHDEKCALISALGNTHSESALRPLVEQFKDNETYYRILSIRAFKNIPGQKSYELILRRLLNTRNKIEALQCLKTLAYKGEWMNPTDSNRIVNIARKSNDNDILNAVKNMFLDLQKYCIKEYYSDIIAKTLEIDKIKRELYIEENVHEVKRESQNFGVYVQVKTESQVRGSEFDFNANTNLDVKVFGKRANLVTAGSANSLVDTNLFMSSAFMTLKLFGREYDLFMKSWKFRLGLGLTAGNPCRANNGIIRHTLSEYFKFGDFEFVYGIAGLASVNLKMGLNGPVSFGYGFNIIGNDSDMYPQQVNVVAQPQANLTASFDVNVNAAIIKVGLQGDLEVVTGSAQTNIALNLPSRKFCHFLHVNATMLRGSIYISGKLGFSFLSKSFRKKLFEWGGAKVSSTVSESFCCPSAFLANSQNLVIPSTFHSPKSLAEKKISDALFLFNATHFCYHSNKSENCPTDLIEHLLKRGVYIFDYTLSKNLNAENQLHFQTGILPILTTGYGDWYGLNELGEVIQLNEIGQFTALQRSPANILADLAYGNEISELSSRQINNKEHLISHQPCEFEARLTTKVLDLRPYCSRMQAVCENIKMGKMYHGDVMVFTENQRIVEINNKEACSNYVQTHGIRYPYYCDAYPFSFTLQGGKGATVMKANVMERNVKTEAVKAFIANSGVKGGDSFVVMV